MGDGGTQFLWDGFTVPFSLIFHSYLGCPYAETNQQHEVPHEGLFGPTFPQHPRYPKRTLYRANRDCPQSGN